MSRWPDFNSRFWANVQVRDGCWEWLGTRQSAGYGVIHAEGRKEYAHRLMWFRSFGSIPDGFCVLHACDNPGCVNPGHLFLGTKADNTRDMWSKGRQGGDPARNAAKDLCRCHGLPLNEKRRCPRNYRNSLSRSEAQALRWATMPSEQAFAIRQKQWATRRQHA